MTLTHLLPALGTGSGARVVIQIAPQLDQAVGFPTEIVLLQLRKLENPPNYSSGSLFSGSLLTVCHRELKVSHSEFLLWVKTIYYFTIDLRGGM